MWHEDLKFEEAGLNLEGKIRVLRLLQLLGSGYGHLCRYNCQVTFSLLISVCIATISRVFKTSSGQAEQCAALSLHACGSAQMPISHVLYAKT